MHRGSAAEPEIFGRREVVLENSTTSKEYTPAEFPQRLRLTSRACYTCGWALCEHKDAVQRSDHDAVAAGRICGRDRRQRGSVTVPADFGLRISLRLRRHSAGRTQRQRRM